mmetsp:Transcript_30572/g.46310  ORF Transcript_30572/g.46310 Transcript_30572/m.46310 type:complete len:150 (+) Transcript_30572:137-586(+)
MAQSYSLLFLIICVVQGFVPSKLTINSNQLEKLYLSSSPNDLPPPSDDDYEGDVDWDAEWKKVVSNQNQPEQRPGKDFYKSEAEIAVTKVVNKAAEKVSDASKQIPTIRVQGDLTSDWRFWIGILAIISVATAVLSAPPQTSVQDSYFI